MQAFWFFLTNLDFSSCYPGVKFQINIGDWNTTFKWNLWKYNILFTMKYISTSNQAAAPFSGGCPALTRIKVLNIEMKFHNIFHNYSVGIYLPLIRQLHLGRNLTPWVPSLDWEASELFAFPPPPVFFILAGSCLYSTLKSTLQLYSHWTHLPSRPWKTKLGRNHWNHWSDFEAQPHDYINLILLSKEWMNWFLLINDPCGIGYREASWLELESL